MGKKRKPPRKAVRRALGPVELPKTDAQLLRDAARLAGYRGQLPPADDRRKKP